jgi:phosphohistidine phosphatase
MDVYLIRHAEALAGDRTLPDAHRPLSARGKQQARSLGEGLARARVHFDALVASPLVRAVETATLVAERLGFAEPLDIAAELSPDHAPGAVIAEVLLPRSDLAAVALVGHEPLLGALLGTLMHAAPHALGKATAVHLAWDGPEQPARFVWVLTPTEPPSPRVDDVG